MIIKIIDSSFFLWLRVFLEQLKSSVTSVRFYQIVYSSYQGYGVKYLFAVVLFSSLFYSVSILNYLLTLNNYFNKVNPANNLSTLEYIIKQLPRIDYDGKQIIVSQDSPIFLFDDNNIIVGAIDTKNQLSFIDRKKIPLLFLRDGVSFLINGIADTKRESFFLKYSRFFDSSKLELSHLIIKEHLVGMIDKISRLFIYFLMPLMVALRLISILFEKFFIISLVYLVSNLFKFNISFKTSSRLVLFTGGVPILLQPVILMFLPRFVNLTFILQVLAYFLLFIALVQLKRDLS